MMGAGLAKAVRRARYPQGYAEYRTLCLSRELVVGDAHLWVDPDGDQPALLNLASQDRPGRHARLGWLTSALTRGVDELAGAGITSLALPEIGCGIGGLHRVEVGPVVEDFDGQGS